jgi:hypothetical protein
LEEQVFLSKYFDLICASDKQIHDVDIDILAKDKPVDVGSKNELLANFFQNLIQKKPSGNSLSIKSQSLADNP